MSGAVGSMPSFTRSGRPAAAACSSLRSSPPSGSESTALRSRKRGRLARIGGRFGHRRPMLDSRLRPGRCTIAARGPARCPMAATRRRRSARPTARPGRAPRAVAPDGGRPAQTTSRRRLEPPRCRTPEARRTRQLAAADDRGGDAPQLHKLRLGLILSGLLVLALVSTVFGMMMAVAQDLPVARGPERVQAPPGTRSCSTTRGKQAARRADRQREPDPGRQRDISSNVKHAVIAIEDQRFYTHKGLDYRASRGRCGQDVRRQRAVQGASTITQQFVKNALVAQTEPLACSRS